MSDIDLHSDDPAFSSAIASAYERVQSWIERCGYAGIEPHDALLSPLVRRTPIGRSRLARLVLLQAMRRLPFNIRPLVGVRPQVNAVTLGWALRAYAHSSSGRSVETIASVLRELRRLQASGYSGACWGYYFDWQTRATFKPAHQPIIVSTAFIGLGLMDLHDAGRVPGGVDALGWAADACRFILRDLNRTEGSAGFAFSYGPDDNEQVFNASMLGAELLARVGAATGDREMLEAARSAVEFTVHHQNPDGSWAYGLDVHWGFIDNFHTGYVLCSLKQYMRATGDERFRAALDRGWRFYREHFFDDDRIPRYYHDRRYPVDAHAAAQSILTLVEFGDTRTAARVAGWTVNAMQTKTGYFIYQIHRRHTNRIAYLRWANALMPYALIRLAAALRGRGDGPGTL